MNIKLCTVNLITMLRVIGTILLIPIYHVYGSLTTGIFSLICNLTDILDGTLARKWKVSTFFGSLFDSASDKIFLIVNFIILYLITPYATIPIIIELSTTLLQFIKFNNNYNIKSNVFGKIKIWFLTASLVAVFIVSDITNAAFVPTFIKEFVLSHPINSVYFWTLFPAIVMELLTFISYAVEIFRPSKRIVNLNIEESKLKEKDFKGKKFKNYLKEIWLNPQFYEEHKNNTNLKDLWKITKTK